MVVQSDLDLLIAIEVIDIFCSPVSLMTFLYLFGIPLWFLYALRVQ